MSVAKLNGPRFDWMQATIREDVDTITATVAGALRGDVEEARGLNGYRASRFIKRDDETLARLLYGGNGNPHLMASGAATDEVVPVLRSSWAGIHEVTRMDSAQDFDQVGGYDRLRSVLLDVGSSARLADMEIVSNKGGVRSRTTYLGSPSSRVRVRLYEKGCMQHQLGDVEASLGWVRLEGQFRPTGQDARLAASALDPVESWGLSAWTRDLARAAFGADVERVTMQPKREPDYTRAVEALRRQYGGVLERALRVEGSWDKVGQLLGVL